MTSSYTSTITKVKEALENIFVKKVDRSHISYGQVDSTSTSTAFTATVTGLTSLTDGATVMLRNGYITSAEGFTLDVNGLGAKPVYNSMADATRDTTIFNINYTMLFVYDSTRVANGCWICYRGYNSDKDTNTIGYQLRTNSTIFTTTDKGYRYRLWLECADGKVMPVNTSTSTNATAKRDTAMNTRDFYLGGRIFYYSTKADTNANTNLTATTMWQQYLVTLGYSFNNTGSALVLTLNTPVYMVAENRGNGMGRLTSPYYTQTLPNTADNKLYIYLGHAISETQIELSLQHPIFEYKNSSIRLFRDTYTSSETDTLLNDKLDKTHASYKGKNVVTNASTGAIEFEDKYSHPTPSGLGGAKTSGLYKVAVDAQGHVTGTTNVGASDLPSHTHSQYSTFSGDYDDLTNKPTIPLATSDLTNDGNGSEPFLTHSDISAVGITNSYEDLDDKPTIPSASSTTPSADVSGGAIGTGTTWAKADHQHPLSSAYATSEHNHNGVYQPVGSYLTSQDITGKQDKSNIVTSWNATLSDEKYPSEKLVKTSLNSKVDTDGNKVLSDNNFTNTYKTTIDDLPNNYQAKGDYASGTHNHSGTYVDGVTGNNTTNGSAIAEIKANTTSKGTIYHPKINNANLTGVPTSNKTLSFGGNFKVNQVNANTDGHVTGLTERTLTLPSLPNIPQSLGDLELEDDSTVYLSNGNALVNFDTISNSISLLDGMLYYDISNQQIIYNNTDVIATLSDIPSNLTVPTASTTTPSADTTSGSYGSGTSYARSNHSHPKSSLYAEATHAHDYTDLTNKPSYTATVTSNTSGAYEIGKINISGSEEAIYGKDTHQSLTPTRVYNCTSFNSTYIDTSSTNNLSLYKLGDLYFLRYFLSTKNLVYSTTDYNINSDTIPSDYRPPGDRTFYVSTNINVNGRIVIKSNGRVTISASANNQTIYTAGTLTYWW